MIHKIVTGVLAVLALLFGGATYFGANSTGPAHYQLESFLEGIHIGRDSGPNMGTKYKFIRTGTCTLQANNSIAATSTGNVSCTGITGYTGASGDVVRLQLAASTTLASQYVIKDAYASTTASGSIEAQLINLTGGAATPAATNGFGSSTVFEIRRPI